jgi:hypothetical protein
MNLEACACEKSSPTAALVSGVDELCVHQVIHAGLGSQTVSADLVTPVAAHGTAHIIVHATAGHIAPGTRGQLIDALLDRPEMQRSERLEATLPLGDAESLLRLCDRCAGASVHAAGSTALIEAHMRLTEPAHE